MFEVIRTDLSRYFHDPAKKNLKGYLKIFYYDESVWFISALRAGQWVRKSCRIPVLRFCLKLVTNVIHRFLVLLTGIQIDFDAEIGPGLYIGHSGKIVVHPDVKIGSYCNLSTGVVIGEAGRGENRGVPVIGDRVYIAPGAKLVGKIKVGSDSAIGANAVVVKDVPEKTTVGGIPAEVISQKGSDGFICHVE